ncbi:hypothetical protein Hanom_Chr03g00274701 [Helianthus anomalus]
MSVVGGISESKGVENSLEIDELARFAVDEHNKKQVSYLFILRSMLSSIRLINSSSLNVYMFEVVCSGVHGSVRLLTLSVTVTEVIG